MNFEIVNTTEKGERKRSVNLIENPSWSLDEIALSEDVIKQIEEMLAYIQNQDKLLREWQFARFLKAGSGLSINFFGAPGTGKSITAEAIAHRLGMSIIKANYGELESAFVGGTSENLSEIFEAAEKSNSLLLFDEADSVLSRRITNLSQAADHGVNSAKSTLLTLLDKFNGVIIFTTNLFEHYDEAFLRRILFNVEFSPPSFEMRTQLWGFHLADTIPRNISYEKLSELSDGLCGGDIKNVTIKLGLRLLTGRIDIINEPVVISEIERYTEIKMRHSMLSL
jgi:ATP-dependent 26S proteasome regulatory subunit